MYLADLDNPSKPCPTGFFLDDKYCTTCDEANWWGGDISRKWCQQFSRAYRQNCKWTGSKCIKRYS